MEEDQDNLPEQAEQLLALIEEEKVSRDDVKKRDNLFD